MKRQLRVNLINSIQHLLENCTNDYYEAAGEELKSEQLRSFQFVVQGVGALFLGAFLSAYLFSLPKGDVLHGEPLYHEMLAIFGGLFFVLILLSLLFSTARKND